MEERLKGYIKNAFTDIVKQSLSEDIQKFEIQKEANEIKDIIDANTDLELGLIKRNSDMRMKLLEKICVCIQSGDQEGAELLMSQLAELGGE